MRGEQGCPEGARLAVSSADPRVLGTLRVNVPLPPGTANGENVVLSARNRATNGSDLYLGAVAPRGVAALPHCDLSPYPTIRGSKHALHSNSSDTLLCVLGSPIRSCRGRGLAAVAWSGPNRYFAGNGALKGVARGGAAARLAVPGVRHGLLRAGDRRSAVVHPRRARWRGTIDLSGRRNGKRTLVDKSGRGL